MLWLAILSSHRAQTSSSFAYASLRPEPILPLICPLMNTRPFTLIDANRLETLLRAALDSV